MDFCDSVVPTDKYNEATNGRKRLWVIHDEEYPEGTNSAENIAQYLARSVNNGGPKASINACVDGDSVVGSVPWELGAWHSGHGPTNRCSIGIEHDGYAHQTREEWLDDYGRGMLTRAARLFVDVGVQMFGMETSHLKGEALRNCVTNGVGSGYCTHADVTEAFGIYGGHTDPGPDFPFDFWDEQINNYLDPANPAPDQPKTETEMIKLTNVDDRRERFQIFNGDVMSCWQSESNGLYSNWEPLAAPQPHKALGISGEELPDGRLYIEMASEAWGVVFGSVQPAPGGGPWIPWYNVNDLITYLKG